jgi:hypothetical protein
MAPTTTKSKSNIRKRKPRTRKNHRGVRTRDGHARIAEAGSPVQPLTEVLNVSETKKRSKPKKARSVPIPVSDDPLEKVWFSSLVQSVSLIGPRILLRVSPC